jgi:AraC-like DNA-binding protein
MVLRNLLWSRLQNVEGNQFENETLALELLGMSLSAIDMSSLSERPTTLAHRQRAVERVKEAVGVAPTHKWSIAELAKIAGISPFHLCHIFRRMTGASIYNYILQERLAQTLDAVLEEGEDLTRIALETGFASHSHFTERFRRFFGCTPTALRRMRATRPTAEIRNIMTARHRRID